MATHQPDETARATVASAICHRRRHQETGAARKYTPARTGRITNACSDLVRNAPPTRTAAATSQPILPRSSERTVAYTAPTRSSVNSASGLLKRNMRAATGVSAMAAPASSAAAGVNDLRTVAYSTPTAATPSRA